MNKQIKAMERADKRQWKYFELVDIKIKKWLSQQGYMIYRIEYIPQFGESAEVLIFCQTEAQLAEYKNNGVTELIKKELIRLFHEKGYVKKFNDKIYVGFDSDENIQKNYEGNYGYRIHDGVEHK